MNQGSSTSDDHAALIQAIAHHRDRAAFAVLFRVFAPRVKAWMIRGGASDTAAEELAQETMLAVWQKATQFDPGRAGVSTWIFTIARNQRIDALRRERHPETLRPDPDGMAGPEQADRAVAIAEQELRIRAALGELPPEQAAVIRKAFFEDKAHAEIERELQIPLGTVKSRLRLAMNRLRAALGDLS
jgi:RNA polymerase sigma-70 factor (ECF subfamily)